MVILETIPNEEAGFVAARKDGGHGGFVDRDECDWLSELFNDVGGNKVDDSDDVVLVSETLPNPFKKPRLEPSKRSAKIQGNYYDDDDDDCVVLDGDPDKPVALVNSKIDVDDDDDVEIVGEKGEVACRDFPHARHLCAKFLFASTPHEAHCSQCHCYICDSVAPCSHWGTGISIIDHCHATDKEEYWRAERKRMKQGNNPAPAVPHVNKNPPSGRAFCQPTQPLAQPHPLAPRFSATSSSVSRPNALNQFRAHPVPVYKPRPQVTAALHSVASRIQNSKHSGSSPYSIRPLGSRLSRNDPMSDIKRMLAERRRGRHVTHQRSTGIRHLHSARQINSLHGVNVGSAAYVPVPSQNHAYSWPYSTVITDPIQGQSQNQSHSQPFVDFNNFVSVASQPSVDNLISPQPPAFQPNNFTYDGNVFGSGSTSGFTFLSNQNSGNQFSHPQTHINPSSVPFGIPIGAEQGKHTENGVDSSVNIVPQCQSTGPTIVSQETDNCRSKESSADILSLTNDAGFQFPESMPPHDTFDFQDYNWILENHSLPVSPLWNSLSPEPSTLDTGNLFDV